MEGARVYVQDTAGSWRRACVQAALGSSRYSVLLEPWEESLADGEGSILEVDASVMEGGILPFQNPNMPETGFPDMTKLDHLHEPALLHNLRQRFFAQACTYTYTADIVIAMNPYRWFPELYTDEKRKKYLVFDRSGLEPHVYATSSRAYAGLQEEKANQTILVSGESGAGKTETVKILMGHLAFVASSDDTTHIQRIVESNPLLESFGNAQTVRNDNSSRFGKFIELEVNSACRLEGSRCRTYLLEKSRVVSQDTGERNFHIFYQMLAVDLQTRARFGLGNTSITREALRYTSMGASKTDTIEGKTDAERFACTVSALALVGVEGENLTALLRALAGVLLLGQLEFSGSDDSSAFHPDAAESSTLAAEVLEIDVGQLETALTNRTIKARGESFVKPLAPAGAAANRDALAKEIYARAFDWLVVQICAATEAPRERSDRFVGLLDIFGFESFAINRFEQLCINYANEKLQQKFTHDVFKSVQQEYAAEGIPWDRIEYKDNAPILALIESKLGIIAMLNEECVRPKGSNQNYVSKLVSVHKEDLAFSVPKLGKMKEIQFSIRHYAGEVMYTAEGWLDRNADTISEDMIALMSKAKNSLLSGLFAIDEGGETKNSKRDTVATKFKTSLAQLMETIGKTSTQYVRCIKPNKNKSPKEVDNSMVVDQLRCAGVIEAIRISRAGFPARMPLAEFAQRFQLLVRRYSGSLARALGSQNAEQQGGALMASADASTQCRTLLRSLVDDDTRYQVGQTRVYFKSGVLELLEERRALLVQAAAVELGRVWRGHRDRRFFMHAKWATRRLQAQWRMRLARSAYCRALKVVIFCQGRRRSVLAARRLAWLRRQRCATRLQSWQRRRVAMREFLRARTAAVLVQSLARRWLCRRHYLASLAEHKEQAKLENQVKALQAKLEAQERAAANAATTANPTVVTQAPAEVLEALQALANENAKLRMELEHQRTENARLRQENHQLKHKETTSGAWLASFMRSKKHNEEERSTTGLPLSRRDSFQEESAAPSLASMETDSGASKNSTERSAAEQPQGLQLYPAMSEFWEDVPCAGVEFLQNGSQVHIKLGVNILHVDIHGKSLVWQPWMAKARGYRAQMGFTIERKKEQQRKSIFGTPQKSESAPENGCLGATFTLRSTWTNKYVKVGGLLDWYCLQVSGQTADDAAAFSCKPVGGANSDYFCALQLAGEDKFLSLRHDGSVCMEKVGDPGSLARNPLMVTCVECLLPAASYEIIVYKPQVGITVSKDLPLRVLGFKHVAQEPGKPAEPGEAELTGRVSVGDVITMVNGQDVSGLSRQDVLNLIANRRPVTLGFLVSEGDIGA